MNDNMRLVLQHLAEQLAPAGVTRVNTPFDVADLDFESAVAPALKRRFASERGVGPRRGTGALRI